jgi:hypothetical protein
MLVNRTHQHDLAPAQRVDSSGLGQILAVTPRPESIVPAAVRRCGLHDAMEAYISPNIKHSIICFINQNKARLVILHI